MLAGWPAESHTLPSYIEPVEVGVPAMLLRRRPDIRAAERQVEANAALLGATRRDWFPQVLLTGSIGFASGEMKHLFRSKSLTWEIAPTIRWNIFSGGERLNATREARSTLDQSILSFNSTLLTAVQEVESAMSQYKSSIEQIVSLREAVNQNEETLALSLELYKQGLSEYQNVNYYPAKIMEFPGYGLGSSARNRCGGDHPDFLGHMSHLVPGGTLDRIAGSGNRDDSLPDIPGLPDLCHL